MYKVCGLNDLFDSKDKADIHFTKIVKEMKKKK